MDYQTYFKQWNGKKVAVLGVGVSNTPLIRMLAAYGAKVTACDKQEQLGETGEELKRLGVELHLGADYLNGIEAELLFHSPGIRPDLPQLATLRKKGCVVTSEMEVFFDLCPAQIIAVTGSDGKTTTTTLIHELLSQEGFACHLGGNIGRPLLPDIAQIRKEDKVVLELSSFQLMEMKKSPATAVITNLAPNHLDWHTGMEEYLQAKKNIFTHQNEKDVLVLNLDNEITAGLVREAKGKTILFSRRQSLADGVCCVDGSIAVMGKKVLRTDEILLPGEHNIENYMAAIGATYGLVSQKTIHKVATTFGGVPHRIEYVHTVNGVRYYNDSIASSPSRAMAGLKSFDRKIIMIAGGYDKKIPFDTLGELICQRVKKLVLMGATGPKIEEAVKKAPDYGQGQPEIAHCTNLQEAVAEAAKDAREGDIVILSPASASFDQFKNFEERGNLFKKLVQELQ